MLRKKEPAQIAFAPALRIFLRLGRRIISVFQIPQKTPHIAGKAFAPQSFAAKSEIHKMLRHFSPRSLEGLPGAGDTLNIPGYPFRKNLLPGREKVSKDMKTEGAEGPNEGAVILQNGRQRAGKSLPRRKFPASEIRWAGAPAFLL